VHKKRFVSCRRGSQLGTFVHGVGRVGDEEHEVGVVVLVEHAAVGHDAAGRVRVLAVRPPRSRRHARCAAAAKAHAPRAPRHRRLRATLLAIFASAVTSRYMYSF
jgi:hypothetical protein